MAHLPRTNEDRIQIDLRFTLRKRRKKNHNARVRYKRKREGEARNGPLAGWHTWSPPCATTERLNSGPPPYHLWSFFHTFSCTRIKSASRPSWISRLSSASLSPTKRVRWYKALSKGLEDHRWSDSCAMRGHKLFTNGVQTQPCRVLLSIDGGRMLQNRCETLKL